MEDSVQDFYRRNVRPMSEQERKQLASLILDELSEKDAEKPKRNGDITKFFGIFDSGDPNFSDNERIDADLGRAGNTDDEELKGQINILERAFRGPITTAINRELNLLRKNNVTGQDLLRTLTNLYYQHNMRDLADRRSQLLKEQLIPKIICSEAFV